MVCSFIEKRSWLVWKFGGTSVANADRLVNVANLVCDFCKILPTSQSFQLKLGCDFELALSKNIQDDGKYGLTVVVSAAAGITDSLNAACTEAAEHFHFIQTFQEVNNLNCKSQTLEKPVQPPQYVTTLRSIRETHFIIVDSLFERGEIDEADVNNFKEQFNSDIKGISEILKAFALSGFSPSGLKEVILGYGELWSSKLLFNVVSHRLKQNSWTNLTTSASSSTNIQLSSTQTRSTESLDAIQQDTEDNHASLTSINPQNLYKAYNDNSNCSTTCKYCHNDLPHKSYHLHANRSCERDIIKWLDARKILIMETPSLSSTEDDIVERVSLNFDISGRLMDEWLICHSSCRVLIVTGYICSLATGSPATLKRNGSDYSGSLFAALLKAKAYTVWTDVDGVYTADPHIVPTAFRLPFLSYIEAIELAYFGAKVLHPLTMEPCIQCSIPIILRSSLYPESPGTLIAERVPEHNAIKGQITANHNCCCRAFTLIDNMSLISVSGSSIIGVPGFAARLFSAVHEAQCSVVMITQGSSEHSICFAVPETYTLRTRIAIESSFYKEIHHDKCTRISVTPYCSLICAVGEHMHGNLGTLGSLASALAKAYVNIKAVAQGSSEVNITFVVSTDQAQRGLQAIHDYAFNSSAALQVSSQVNINIPRQQQQQQQQDRHTLKRPSITNLSVNNNNTWAVVLVPLAQQEMVVSLDLSLCSKNPHKRQFLLSRVLGYTDGFQYIPSSSASSFDAIENPIDLFNPCRAPSALVIIDMRDSPKLIQKFEPSMDAALRSYHERFLSICSNSGKPVLTITDIEELPNILI